MEKYNALSKITEDYLDGTLCRLVMEYENKHDLHVSMQYKDRFDKWFDYELIIHKQKKSVDFIKHDTYNMVECLHLNRITQFENALVDYLYAN